MNNFRTKTLEKEIINKKHDLKILTMYKIQLSKDINEISLKEEKICQLEEKMKVTTSSYCYYLYYLNSTKLRNRNLILIFKGYG